MIEVISRRTFLAAAAATAIAVSSRPASAGAFTGRIQKAVKYNMIAEDLPPGDKFKLLRDLGYDGVEIGAKDGLDAATASKASGDSGLPIHGVVLGSVDGIPAAVDLAKGVGASSVLLVAGRVDEKKAYAQNYIETQDIIKNAIEYAASQDILLLVENVWNNFLLSPLEMARYVDEMNNPQVGVYFDVGNVARYGWPEHWIPVLGKRIHKLDIKEYSRTKQFEEGTWKGFEVEIGDGEIDWAAVRRELDAIGFAGWATAEVPGGDRRRLEDIATRMNRVLDL